MRPVARPHLRARRGQMPSLAVRGKFHGMIRTSKAAQIETAVRMYVNETRAHVGQIPCIKADMYEVARRLIRLEYDPVTSTHRLPSDVDTYLEARAFDPRTLYITDYERFDGALEARRKNAHPKSRNRQNVRKHHRRRRFSLAA